MVGLLYFASLCHPFNTDAGDYKTSFRAKAEAISEALIGGSYKFGFLHVKAIDDTGHDRAVALKVASH